MRRGELPRKTQKGLVAKGPFAAPYGALGRFSELYLMRKWIVSCRDAAMAVPLA